MGDLTASCGRHRTGVGLSSCGMLGLDGARLLGSADGHQESPSGTHRDGTHQGAVGGAGAQLSTQRPRERGSSSLGELLSTWDLDLRPCTHLVVAAPASHRSQGRGVLVFRWAWCVVWGQPAPPLPLPGMQAVAPCPLFPVAR